MLWMIIKRCKWAIYKIFSRKRVMIFFRSAIWGFWAFLQFWVILEKNHSLISKTSLRIKKSFKNDALVDFQTFKKTVLKISKIQKVRVFLWSTWIFFAYLMVNYGILEFFQKHPSSNFHKSLLRWDFDARFVLNDR